MDTNGRYVMETIGRYTLALFEHCQREKVPLLYASCASVYGGGVFRESRECEAPLNV